MKEIRTIFSITNPTFIVFDRKIKRWFEVIQKEVEEEVA